MYVCMYVCMETLPKHVVFTVFFRKELWGLIISVDNTECWRLADDQVLPTQFNVTCNERGRVVKFEVNETKCLFLCEVQIFGMLLLFILFLIIMKIIIIIIIIIIIMAHSNIHTYIHTYIQVCTYTHT